MLISFGLLVGYCFSQKQSFILLAIAVVLAGIYAELCEQNDWLKSEDSQEQDDGS